MNRTLVAFGAALAVLACRASAAGDEDPAKGTWKIDSSATSAKVAEGGKGKVAFSIVTVKGVKVSAEAPLKVQLKADGLKLEKTALANGDAIDAKSGHPRFEVPFVGVEKGSHPVDADLSFFVCTEKWCIRQKEKLSLEVEVQ